MDLGYSGTIRRYREPGKFWPVYRLSISLTEKVYGTEETLTTSVVKVFTGITIRSVMSDARGYYDLRSLILVEPVKYDISKKIAGG